MNLAERITTSMATWTFIAMFLCSCLLEIAWNHLRFAMHHHLAFDPTTIILNLVLSLIAAVQGSIIMIAQNAQASRDRERQERDYQMTQAILHMNQSMQKVLTVVASQTQEILEEMNE